MLMNGLLKCCKSSENETMEINGPSQTSHVKMYSGLSTKTDNMFRIHYDMWPNSANSFITRRKANNWPSNRILEYIQSQGCDVAPVGHHESK
jgi:hypothetical protein